MRLLHVRLEVVLQIEVNDLAAGRHDIAHHAVPQIEDVEDKLATERRNVFRFFALLENQPQFLFAVGQLPFGDGLDTKKTPKDPVTRRVEEAKSPV